MLVHLPLVDLLLQGAAEHQPVHHDVALLADPPRALPRLDVGHGVPVGVEDEDPVGADDVEAHAADPGRQDHREEIQVAVEVVDERQAALDGSLSVDAEVRVAHAVHPLLKNVQHHDGLDEDQWPVSVGPPLLHDLRQNLHLAGPLGVVHVLGLAVRVRVLQQQVRMVAELPQDGNAEERGAKLCAVLASIRGTHPLARLVCLQELDVHLVLLRREVAKQDLLLLVGQLQDVHALCFRAPENMRLRELAQRERALVRGGDDGLARAHEVAGLNGRSHFLFENRERAKQAGANEIEQRPQLLEVVLDRRARQDDPVRGAELLRGDSDSSVRRPDLLPLVEDQQHPRGLQELLLAPAHGLVRRDEHPLLLGRDLDGLPPLGLADLVHDADPQQWVPRVQLIAPLADQRRGTKDQHPSSRGRRGNAQRRVLHAHVLQHA
mmetsp:Transcript_13168/g.39245  ORF Transcript_13168/g.39245 Transcript_13168/m.39245 type:complete len:436 (+) Transcript_13168:550-1857(+)